MAREPEENQRVRMFVALDLPDAVREGIGAWSDAAVVDPALRAVRPESLHVTLAFLGLRPFGDAEEVAAAIEECVAPAPLIELLDAVAKPNPRRAQLFALPVVSPGAEQIQASLSELLNSAGLYKRERRDYWPHVTVARVRMSARGSRRPMSVERPPTELPEGLSEAFYGVRMTLYRSVLQPQGAQYVPMAQVELPGAGRQ